MVEPIHDPGGGNSVTKQFTVGENDDDYSTVGSSGSNSDISDTMSSYSRGNIDSGAVLAICRGEKVKAAIASVTSASRRVRMAMIL